MQQNVSYAYAREAITVGLIETETDVILVWPCKSMDRLPHNHEHIAICRQLRFSTRNGPSLCVW